MKKILCGLAIAATAMMASTAQAADGKLHIKGQLNGLKDSLVVVIPGNNDGFTPDTILTPNGKFDFTINVNTPARAYLYTPATMRGEETVGFQLLAVPGETVELSGDINSSYYLSGSKFYQQFNEGDRIIEQAEKPIIAYTKSLDERLKAGETREALMKEYDEKMPALSKAMTDAILNFVQQHPDYEASAAFIPQLEDIELMKKAVAMLTPEVRDGRMKPLYQSIFDKAEARAKAEAEAAKKQATGVPAPDFTLYDLNDNPLSLSSLKGKYVILDFWGSWCGWCIKGFPEMKEYYNKYKGKFEILGIDCNDTEAKWKDAVKKHELPWLHVYNPKGSPVLSAYGIQGFPTKIIVGPDGKIVKTIVGEDPAFYTFLDETFGK